MRWRCPIPLTEEQIDEVRVPFSARDGELHLLIADLYQDDVGSYRRREAAWISGVVHVVVILLLLFLPKWIGDSVVVIPMQQKQNATFITLPEDQLKVKAPKTDIISDKNRIAQSRTPVPDREILKKLLDQRRPGPPKPAPAPAPAADATQQAPPQPAAVPVPAQPAPVENARLQAPIPERKPATPFAIKSPGSSVTQAIQSVANGHGPSTVDYGGGDYGPGQRPRADKRDEMEILSDTMGVDFGPYLRRLKVTVQSHWDPLIPEVALPPMMKKGSLIIEFAIMKDGSVQGLKLISSSGDAALDRAAWGAITSAVPFNPLPADFKGDFLKLRARFIYNPDRNDFD
ncbi:MAG: energy transducer TonB [Acidobacteriia bacterium]|nr:energy transducer TonB [Terriglobia bacterium]